MNLNWNFIIFCITNLTRKDFCSNSWYRMLYAGINSQDLIVKESFSKGLQPAAGYCLRISALERCHADHFRRYMRYHSQPCFKGRKILKFLYFLLWTINCIIQNSLFYHDGVRLKNLLRILKNASQIGRGNYTRPHS